MSPYITIRLRFLSLAFISFPLTQGFLSLAFIPTHSGRRREMEELVHIFTRLKDFLPLTASLFHLEGDIMSIQKELGNLLPVLDTLSKKDPVKEIRVGAYELEDAIDSYILEVHGEGSFPPSFRKNMVHTNNWHVISRYLRKSFEIKKKIDNLKFRVFVCKFRINSMPRVAEHEDQGRSSVSEDLHTLSPESSRLYDNTILVGCEENKASVIKHLLSSDKNTAYSIISIVDRMSGVGKTTLAKTVYQSHDVRKHFDLQIWVSASDSYRVCKFLKRLIRAVVGLKDKDDLDDDFDEEVEELKWELKELLIKKGRYLIVMDDLCKIEVWDQIRTAFPDTGNGSRIIITTRLGNLNHPAIVHSVELENCLKENDSRALFLSKIYPNQGVTTFPQDLEDVGQKFLGICEGFPLALEVLGGLISTIGDNRDHWTTMLEKFKGSGLHELLHLSYQCLPYYLKPCFLHIASFSHGYEISVRQLIKLWTAVGFIPSTDEKSGEMAEVYIEELIQRSMVQAKDRRFDGRVQKIRINYLMYEACFTQMAKLGFFNSHSLNPESVTMTRFLAIHDHIDNTWTDQHAGNLKFRKLRVLVGLNLSSEFKICQYISGLKFLRVIDLEGSFGLRMLPVEITSLFLLEFLRFVDVTKLVLPSSIANLQNLHTLDVSNGARLQYSLDPSQKIFGCLKSLQVLKRISCGTWIKNDLAELTKIQKLAIQDIQESHKKDLLESLQNLESLASLSLCTDESIPSEILTLLQNHKSLCKLYLEGRLSTRWLPTSDEFPSNLTKLTLEYTKLEKDPMAILEKLSQLVHLKLLSDAYVGKTMTCSADMFPKMRCLVLDGLTYLEYWEVKAQSMPCLTHLAVNRCRALKRLWGLQYLTNLKELQLLYMSQELKQRTREEKGADWYKIQHVPSIVTNNL